MSGPGVEALACEVLGTTPVSIEQVLVSGRGYEPPYVHRLRTDSGVIYLKHGTPRTGGSFALEAWAYDRCRAMGVRVPEVVATAEPGSDVEYIATLALPGRSLWTKPFLSARTLARVLGEAGAQLRAMHEIAVEGFGPIRGAPPQGTSSRWCPYLDQALDVLPGLVAAGVVDDGEGEAMRARLAAAQPTLLPDGPGRLLHGDLEGDHVFAHRGRFTGFLDFEKMQSGDPVFDLARYAWWDDGGFPSLLDGYGRDRLTDDDVHLRMPAYVLANAIVGVGRQLPTSEAAARHARMFVGTAWMRDFSALCARPGTSSGG